MGLLWSSYYGLVRLNELAPEAKGWATTDTNYEIISRLIKAQELHVHSTATPMRYPGYNFATPATPIRPTLTQVTSGGSLAPGSQAGIRLSFIDQFGLETDGSPETILTLSPMVQRPNAPNLNNPSATPVIGAIPGGGYIYALTKVKSTSETDISNVASVTVPYDASQSYTVTGQFDPINTYTDGTDSLRVYRSTGYNTPFVLLQTITNVTSNQFLDDNTIQDKTIQPPAKNTFNQFNLINIDWSSISVPSTASKLRVYITRNIGQWGAYHLYNEYDLTHSYSLTANFLGTETLAKGWPNETSETMGSPPLVNLKTGATGAFILTDYPDFRGFGAWNFVVSNSAALATPIDGAIYYDPSIPAFRGRVQGGWQNFATPIVGQAAGAGYIHPALESGGHSDDNIIVKQPAFSYGAGGQPTVAQVLSTFTTPVVQFRKQGTGIFKAPSPTTPISTNLSSATYMDLDTGVIVPSFTGQWMETEFSAHIYCDSSNAVITTEFEIDGVNIEETTRSETAGPSQGHVIMSCYFATPVGNNTRIKVKWWVSKGTAIALSTRRTLVSKMLF